jgi:SPP1 family predicted phage head-tail adaptor
MRRKYPIQLIKRTYESDTSVQSVNEEPPREILAKRKAIRQSEFYQSVASGFRPEITFVIYEAEYMDEDRLAYDDKDYEIIRTYPLDNEKEIELVCQRVDDANRNLSRLRTGF